MEEGQKSFEESSKTLKVEVTRFEVGHNPTQGGLLLSGVFPLRVNGLRNSS